MMGWRSTEKRAVKCGTTSTVHDRTWPVGARATRLGRADEVQPQVGESLGKSDDSSQTCASEPTASRQSVRDVQVMDSALRVAKG